MPARSRRRAFWLVLLAAITLGAATVARLGLDVAEHPARDGLAVALYLGGTLTAAGAGRYRSRAGRAGEEPPKEPPDAAREMRLAH